MLSLLARIVLLLPVGALLGCAATAASKGESPLSPTQMSCDSVVLEVFFVRCPFGDPNVNGTLWQEVDEQHFPPQLRQRLTRNGFRAGLLAGPMPFALSKLLELQDKPAPAGQAHEADLAKSGEPPRVVRRHMVCRAGKRNEIVSSDVHEQLPLLFYDAGQLGGQTYEKAQVLWCVKAFPQRDGRVRLQLVPELHHDEPCRRWVGQRGMLRLETSRPCRAFDDLALRPTLAPGTMLVLSGLPNRPGSLGHHFFTEADGQWQQKLLVIRLAQTQHDDLFCPAEPLDLSVLAEQ